MPSCWSMDHDLLRQTSGVDLVKTRYRTGLFSLATLIVATSVPSVLCAESATSPNFVLILTDDQGWTGTSVSMHPTIHSKSDYQRTLHLERLARAGMRFSQGYSPAGLCCPTRRSIQFGQTPLRQGDDAQFVQRYPVGNKRPTIPRFLKAVNPRYAAAHFWKWDLRTDLAPEHLAYVRLTIFRETRR